MSGIGAAGPDCVRPRTPERLTGQPLRGAHLGGLSLECWSLECWSLELDGKVTISVTRNSRICPGFGRCPSPCRGEWRRHVPLSPTSSGYVQLAELVRFRGAVPGGLGQRYPQLSALQHAADSGR